MIAALLLDAIGPGFFAATAAHCDEAATTHDDCRRKRRRGVSRGGVPWVLKVRTYFRFAFLALVALATFAFFFFAAIVSTSPDIGMLIASAAIL